MQSKSKSHISQKFSDFEDCFSVLIPRKPRIHETSILEELFEVTCNEIDRLSGEVLNRKFKKLSAQVLDQIQQQIQQLSELAFQKYHFDDIVFVMLSVDQANRDQVNGFYRLLNNHPLGEALKISNEQQAIVTSLQTFIAPSKNLADLVNLVLQKLKLQYTSKVDAHCSVFLISAYDLSIEDLQLFKKTINEELQFRFPTGFHKIILILPASESMIINYEANGLMDHHYYFSNPQTMLVELILKLIQHERLPLFSKELYLNLQQHLSLYISSYQDQLYKIKIAYFLFYFSKEENKLTCYLDSFNDQPTKNPLYYEYMKCRHQLTNALQQFAQFIEQIKKFIQIKGLKGSLLSLITSNKQKFFQSGMCTNIDNLVDCFMRMKIDAPEFSMLLNRFEREVGFGVANFKDRGMMIVQNNSKSDRFDYLVNEFLHQFVQKKIIVLRTMFSQYLFDDMRMFTQTTNPDILEEYHVDLTQSKHEHLREIQTLYSSMGHQGVKIAVSTIYTDQQPHTFFHYLGMLKILGLIETTKSTKITYQRHYFAKQVYKNYIGD